MHAPPDPRRHHARRAPWRAAWRGRPRHRRDPVARRPHGAPAAAADPDAHRRLRRRRGPGAPISSQQRDRRGGRRHPSVRGADVGATPSQPARPRRAARSFTRPPWRAASPATAGSRSATREAAAGRSGATPRRVFLTIGRQELAAFAAAPQHHYLVRSDRRAGDDRRLPRLRARSWRAAPFALADEMRADARARRIDVLVTKNSGGAATARKIEAARALGLPVVMVARARPAAGATAARRRRRGAGLDRGSSRAPRSCAASAARARPGPRDEPRLARGPTSPACHVGERRDRPRRASSARSALVGAADGARESDRRRAGLQRAQQREGVASCSAAPARRDCRAR